MLGDCYLQQDNCVRFGVSNLRPCATVDDRLGQVTKQIGDTSFRYAPSGLPGDPPFPGDVGPGCSFAPRCPVARDDCTSGELELTQVAEGRMAACRHPVVDDRESAERGAP